MQQNHVVIAESDGRPTLRIDDWELYDFIDDHLTDHDIEYDYLTEEEVGSVCWYVLHFRSSVDPARLKEVLNLIDPEEIERIWQINN